MRKPQTRKELDSLNGKLVVVTNNCSNFLKGEKFVLVVKSSSTVSYPDFADKKGNRIRHENFELCPATKADFEKDLKKLDSDYEKQKKEIISKIEYLQQSDAGEYNDEEFKAFYALKSIEENLTLSPIEKARLLMKSLK